MSAKDGTLVFRVTGELFIDPTNLGTVPGLGMSLGVYDQLIVQPMMRHILYRDVDSDRANQIIDIKRLSSTWMVGVSMRQTDNDAWDAVFPDHSAAAAGPLISGETDAGDRLVGRRLLFRAENVLEHPSLLLFNAVPLLVEDSELSLEALTELVLETVFYATPDDTGRTRELGVLNELTQVP